MRTAEQQRQRPASTSRIYLPSSCARAFVSKASDLNYTHSERHHAHNASYNNLPGLRTRSTRPRERCVLVVLVSWLLSCCDQTKRPRERNAARCDNAKRATCPPAELLLLRKVLKCCCCCCCCGTCGTGNGACSSGEHETRPILHTHKHKSNQIPPIRARRRTI